MKQKQNIYVPQLNTESGLCLTAANWQDVGLNTASFSLSELLFKPGLQELKSTKDLKKYLVSTGPIIIDASQFPPLKNENYVLISPYDGSKLLFSVSDLVQLTQDLKPEAVLFPKDSCSRFSAYEWTIQTQVFFHEKDIENNPLPIPHGVYFFAKDYLSQRDLLEKLDTVHPIPTYVIANADSDFFYLLNQPSCNYIQSDRPAYLGARGKVFSERGIIDLTLPEFASQFEPIAASCSCPTCAQKLTKSYLHHLIHNTPLLCQRFLIQHNACFSFTF